MRSASVKYGVICLAMVKEFRGSCSCLLCLTSPELFWVNGFGFQNSPLTQRSSKVSLLQPILHQILHISNLISLFNTNDQIIQIHPKPVSVGGKLKNYTLYKKICPPTANHTDIINRSNGITAQLQF